MTGAQAIMPMGQSASWRVSIGVLHHVVSTPIIGAGQRLWGSRQTVARVR